jgi:lipopolysaccharide transport system permease protein
MLERTSEATKAPFLANLTTGDPASVVGKAAAGSPAVTDLPVTRIRPRPGWRPLELAELWRYRELLGFLALRDIQLRYRQTVLGVAWAILQPLLTMVVFSVFFGQLGKMPSDGLPYPLFALVGLLPWQLFAYALTQSSNSLVAEQRLITKVYFPRLLVPLASVLSGLADFAVALPLAVLLLLAYGIAPGSGVLVLPLLVLFALATALAVGLWLAALNAQFRDVRYMLPFLTQLWMFVTPIAYPSSLVPEDYRPLLGLNPLAGVVEGFRWALLGQETAPGPLVAVSVVTVMVLLIGGLFYFRRLERSFADVL